MKFPLRFFLTCLALALAVIVGGLLYSRLLDHRLAEAVANCEAVDNCETEDKEHAAKHPGTWGSYFCLVCTPSDLINGETVPPGTQGAVVVAYKAKLAFNDGAVHYIIACALVVLGALPAIWYFLLRRIREIAAAVRGE